jgi:hypothetical protein
LPVVFADYYLADSIVNITVLDNGLVNVAEDFTYSFNGCYNIIYADIPVIASQIISIAGYSDYAFVPYSELNGTHFIFEFRFNDSQCNKLVRTILEYNMSNAVDSYDDISSINFMFWGIGAPFTESLTANIKVPNSIIDYWIHNSAKEHSISSDNSIIFSQKNIGAGNWIETRVIFERLNNNSYSSLKSLEGLKIITGQEIITSFL